MPDARKGTALMAGAHLSVAAGGEGRDGLGRREKVGRVIGPGQRGNGLSVGVHGPAGKKRETEREKKCWAFWAENKERKKKWLCIFLKRTNTFKSNLNSGIQTQNER